MVISDAKIEDAKSLAVLHKLVFGKIHFTTSFSIYLLTIYFENLIAKMKYGIVIKDNNDIVGYLFAGRNIGQIINNFLKANLLKVFFYLLRNPRFILEKIRELFSTLSSKNKNTRNELSLYLIAVDTRLGRRGIGKELIYHFEDLSKRNDEKSYTLSVRKNNQKAIDFYLKNKYVQIETDEKSIKFKKEFDSR
jgi:ribosomal protein S18 acetylase RimI-like enzyme